MTTREDFARANEYYKAGEYQKAFDMWITMTEEPTAMFNAGAALLNKKIPCEDKWNQAYFYFKKAADMGYTKAYYYCGYLLELFGQECKDESQKMRYFDEAAFYYFPDIRNNDKSASGLTRLWQRGSVIANGMLAYDSYFGISIPENLELARMYSKDGIDAGERYFAPLIYGFLARDDNDFENAFKYLKIAAESKNDKAYGPLGDCYRRGQGTSVNYTEAIRWYQKGAETGHGDATLCLGFMYLKGMGCKKNKDQAVLCFNQCVDSISPNLLGIMGILYYLNEGGLNDKEKGIQLIQKAADKGSPLANGQYGVMKFLGQDVVQNYNEAFARLMVDKDTPRTQEYIGHCYAFGLGCQKNMDLAQKYMISSLEGGNKHAANYLTPSMVLRPYAKWDIKSDGAEFLGKLVAAVIGNLLDPGTDD